MTSRAVHAQNRSEVDAEAVADAVLACSHVFELSGGSVGEVATYLPGRRVAGVRTTNDALEVHVVAYYGPTVDEVADQVRAAAEGHSGGRRVDVTVEDLQLDEPSDPERSREPRGAADPAAAGQHSTSSSERAGTDPETGLARPTRVTMPPAEPGLA